MMITFRLSAYSMAMTAVLMRCQLFKCGAPEDVAEESADRAEDATAAT
jgi:hypothetical protein